MASLSLTSTSYSVLSTVDGLSADYDGNRRFVWSLDGVQVASELVSGTYTSHSYTVEPVYFNSQHTVSVVVTYWKDDPTYVAPDPDPDDPDAEPEPVPQVETVEYEGQAQTMTLIPELDYWFWSQSNGDASADETAQAYDAADEQDLCQYFGYQVWDDLVNKVAEMRRLTGQSWLTTYGSLADTLMGERYASLTARRFNALVANINYPYWDWWYSTAILGYLGRLVVQSSNDDVYGAYMLELAERINNMVGIYTDTTTKPTSASAHFYHDVDAWAVAKPSVRFGADHHTQHTIDGNAVAKPSAPMARDLAITLGIESVGRAFPSAPLKIENPVSLFHRANFLAYNPMPMEQYLLMTTAVSGNLSRAVAKAIPLAMAQAQTNGHGLFALAVAKTLTSASAHATLQSASSLELQRLLALTIDIHAFVSHGAGLFATDQTAGLVVANTNTIVFGATLEATGPVFGMMGSSGFTHGTQGALSNAQVSAMMSAPKFTHGTHGDANALSAIPVTPIAKGYLAAVEGVAYARKVKAITSLNNGYLTAVNGAVHATLAQMVSGTVAQSVNQDGTITPVLANVMPQADAPLFHQTDALAVLAPPTIIPQSDVAVVHKTNGTVNALLGELMTAQQSLSHGQQGTVAIILPLPLSASAQIALSYGAEISEDEPSSTRLYPVDT